MKFVNIVLIASLLLAAALIIGCNIEKNKWKDAPLAPADYAKNGQQKVEIPSPQLDGEMEKLDTAAYTDPQGRFLAEISNKMLEAVKEGK